jgi:hypothetical protein
MNAELEELIATWTKGAVVAATYGSEQKREITKVTVNVYGVFSVHRFFALGNPVSWGVSCDLRDGSAGDAFKALETSFE